MELMTLRSTDFQPVKLVENYDSLIWTERYWKNGDFQLVTSNVEEGLRLLPLESYVTLRESTVPMIVEIHKIEKDPQQAPKLTVIGRSFETVLERRASVKELDPDGEPPTETWTIQADKESDAAYQAMRVVLGDVNRFQGEIQVLSGVTPAVSPLDAIPEIDLTLPVDYSTGTTNTYEIKRGNLYNTVLDLVNIRHRGIKAVRPDQNGSKVSIEIYNGADLSSFVLFDAKFDQFDKATYLLSKQSSTNVGYVYGPNGADVVLKTAAAEPSGLERRVLLVDEMGNADINTSDIRRSRGLVELYKYNQTALFDGEIAVQVAGGFNSLYFLGDIVKLNGEYGLSETVRVAEFIRSSDNSGTKAYPTFETVDLES